MEIMSQVCISVSLLPAFTTSLQKLFCSLVSVNIFEQYGTIHNHNLVWKEQKKPQTHQNCLLFLLYQFYKSVRSWCCLGVQEEQEEYAVIASNSVKQ